MRDGAGADEGYVAYGGVRSEMVGRLGPADKGLDEIGGVNAALKGGAGDGCKEGGRPGGAFGGFDNNGGAGEDGRYYRTY